MIAWLNFVMMVLATLLMWFFYVKSVRPAALSRQIGDRAYRRCGRFRIVASAFEMVVAVTYFVTIFYPAPLDLPTTFSWPYWVSLLIAVVIGVPSGYLMWRGLKDAGKEALTPRPEHTMYGGIYEKIRHPQAVGELPFWWVFAFLFHSPFLTIYSIVWIPIFWHMCVAEEQDLLLRYGEPYAAYRDRTGFWWPRKAHS